MRPNIASRPLPPLLPVLAALALPLPTGADAPESPARPAYEQRAPSLDGTGRFFMGREIARVMGHLGAPWLERPERIDEERPDLLHSILPVKPGHIVADIGAGTGYHSWRLARQVGPTGRVYAVEIQPEMLQLLATNMHARGVTNVVGILGSTTDPALPEASVDLALMVDVYHEFDHPYEMLAAITRALKPGGRVAFVEFRGEQASVPIKPLHKMTEAQVRREAELHPLEWVETRRELPWQHLILFRKTPAP
ncbi:MAG: class I SAM-dependent methyltransferase [Verrucomicrobiae bacterium]|nr:class I SAM-dependent methyltransferase [Verrucomicrobiae bacterium]